MRLGVGVFMRTDLEAIYVLGSVGCNKSSSAYLRFRHAIDFDGGLPDAEQKVRRRFRRHLVQRFLDTSLVVVIK